jgi:hypothetical protein
LSTRVKASDRLVSTFPASIWPHSPSVEAGLDFRPLTARTPGQSKSKAPSPVRLVTFSTRQPKTKAPSPVDGGNAEARPQLLRSAWPVAWSPYDKSKAPSPGSTRPPASPFSMTEIQSSVPSYLAQLPVPSYLASPVTWRKESEGSARATPPEVTSHDSDDLARSRSSTRASHHFVALRSTTTPGRLLLHHLDSTILRPSGLRLVSGDWLAGA